MDTTIPEQDADSVPSVRHIPLGSAACAVCDNLFPLKRNRGGGYENRVHIHGPRNTRCPGSYQDPKPYVDGARLPRWEAMSEIDRGAALMFLWKVYWERDYSYARKNYPARYWDDPRLVGLDGSTSCRHASACARLYVVEWLDRPSKSLHVAMQTALGDIEHQRLYDLALDREDAERRARTGTSS